VEPFDVFRRLDQVAEVDVVLGTEDGVVDDDPVDAPVVVRGDDGALALEARDAAKVEAHADVLATFPRVFRVGLGGAVVGCKEADEDERFGERGDLGSDFRSVCTRDLGGIENESHG
jgi:hypothetical protein